MIFKSITILAAVFLLTSPVAPNAKRDMHIEKSAPITAQVAR